MPRGPRADVGTALPLQVRSVGASQMRGRGRRPHPRARCVVMELQLFICEVHGRGRSAPRVGGAWAWGDLGLR